MKTRHVIESVIVGALLVFAASLVVMGHPYLGLLCLILTVDLYTLFAVGRFFKAADMIAEDERSLAQNQADIIRIMGGNNEP